MVIDLPTDVKDVLVADPKIANAVVRSARRAYLIGVAVGQTNVFFFDADGRQIAGYDIAVTRDLNGVRAALRQALPDVQIEGVGDGIMLRGSVTSPAESQQAYDLAVRLTGSDAKVFNGISIRGRDQVMLKVTVAEVQRDVIKQLGIDLNGSFSYGATVVNFNNTNPFSAIGTAAQQQQYHCDQRRQPDCHPARDGARRRHPHSGRTEPHRHLRRDRDLHRRRRISDPVRPELRYHEVAADLPIGDRMQEVRRQLELHACRADGRPHQPQGHDRGFRSFQRQCDDITAAGLHADP